MSENTANAVVSNEEGAWAAEEVMERDQFSLDEVEDEVEIEGESCEEVVQIGDTSGLALVALDSAKPGETAKLYDSRCTNHISPYCDRFENFENIIPRKFRAANQ